MMKHLKIHETDVHGRDRPRLVCDDCGACFKHKHQLVQHSAIHQGEYVCKDSNCGTADVVRIFDKRGLKGHQKKIHGHLYKHHSASNYNLPYVCGHSTCRKGFKSLQALQTHNRLGHRRHQTRKVPDNLLTGQNTSDHANKATSENTSGDPSRDTSNHANEAADENTSGDLSGDTSKYANEAAGENTSEDAKSEDPSENDQDALEDEDNGEALEDTDKVDATGDQDEEWNLPSSSPAPQSNDKTTLWRQVPVAKFCPCSTPV
ncbi:hypothetical protein PYCC9005_003889 [Savitreella phatthalungensis]